LLESESRIDDRAEAAGLRVHHQNGAFVITESFSRGLCQRPIYIGGVCGRFTLFRCALRALCGFFLPRARTDNRGSE
jgi:hypothetical protein